MYFDLIISLISSISGIYNDTTTLLFIATFIVCSKWLRLGYIELIAHHTIKKQINRTAKHCNHEMIWNFWKITDVFINNSIISITNSITIQYLLQNSTAVKRMNEFQMHLAVKLLSLYLYFRLKNTLQYNLYINDND